MYISQDPIGLAGGNPTLYGYVKDSNWRVDVFGLDEEINGFIYLRINPKTNKSYVGQAISQRQLC